MSAASWARVEVTGWLGRCAHCGHWPISRIDQSMRDIRYAVWRACQHGQVCPRCALLWHRQEKAAHGGFEVVADEDRHSRVRLWSTTTHWEVRVDLAYASRPARSCYAVVVLDEAATDAAHAVHSGVRLLATQFTDQPATDERPDRITVSATASPARVSALWRTDRADHPACYLVGGLPIAEHVEGVHLDPLTPFRDIAGGDAT